jgi:hypothetical protein
MEEGMRKICTSPSGGSPRLKYTYDGEECDRMIAWFRSREKVCDDVYDKAGRPTVTAVQRPPTPEEYCSLIGITMDIFNRWQEEHRGFKEAFKRCKNSMVTAGWDWGRAPGCGKQAQFYLMTQCGVGMNLNTAEIPSIVVCEDGKEPMVAKVELPEGDEVITVEPSSEKENPKRKMEIDAETEVDDGL